MITAYTLVFGGLLLLGGRVADYVGARRVLLLSLVGIAPRPGVQIVLEPVEETSDIVARTDRRAPAQLLTNGALNRIEFTTVDCDATFDLLVAAGAVVVQEPMDQRDGSRCCAVFDPSGNRLRFTQRGRQRGP